MTRIEGAREVCLAMLAACFGVEVENLGKQERQLYRDAPASQRCATSIAQHSSTTKPVSTASYLGNEAYAVPKRTTSSRGNGSGQEGYEDWFNDFAPPSLHTTRHGEIQIAPSAPSCAVDDCRTSPQS